MKTVNCNSDIRAILKEEQLDGSSDRWRTALQKVTAADVERCLAQPAGTYSLQKISVLLSPAAESYLEEMAQLVHHLTVRRFGRTVQLYAPLYLSNFCINSCIYCGFNTTNEFERTRLTIAQALCDADIIASEGFKDVLLVSGEDPDFVTVDYLTELTENLKAKFSSISMEVYPMSNEQYQKLYRTGIDGVTLYQETYNRRAYAHHHPAGPKTDYDHRLASHDRAAQAGMRRLGLGVLLGLTDWRTDTIALAEHAHYLIKRYWQAHVSFSFPRLRPAYNVKAQFEYLLSDKNLVQMILALRLCFADAGLVLSTRERAELRDRLIKLGVTKMSAGSKTSPGGYYGLTNAAEQFKIDDCRSPAEVADMIRATGFDAVWKDSDTAFIPN